MICKIRNGMQLNRAQRRGGQHGFSLTELMIVLAILLIMASVGTLVLQPALKQMHVSNAYNTTLATMRLARQTAVSNRNIYTLTFSNAAVPNTLTIADTDPINPRIIETVSLPTDVQFTVVAGIPNTLATTPDHFGTAGAAIDFDQGVTPNVQNVIYFYPDGSAQDVGNNINNGVVYVAQPGVIMSSRAVTIWGATGRLRGWRLYGTAGAYTWSQQ